MGLLTKNRRFLIVVLLAFMMVNVFSQTATDNSFLVKGYDSYQKGDWTSAMFFLRQAASIPQSASPEVWYMLIMSEMFADEYESAIKDSNVFLSFYPDSSYKKFVEYQLGRALHYTGSYDESIKVLGSFCVNNEKHELFPSALFWMAESFYMTYYFDSAKPLYERILNDFPDSPKVTETRYRLDLILQRQNEEKLLQLLKATGEEFLSSRDDYEKQLKQFQTEESIGLRKKLQETLEETQRLVAEVELEQRKNKEAQKQINTLKNENKQLMNTTDSDANSELEANLKILKQKVMQLQEVLNEEEEIYQSVNEGGE